MVIVGKKRGLKLFFSLFLNFVVLMVLFYLIGIGLNAVLIAFLGCFVISYIILYCLNGKNEKTMSSMQAIILVLILLAFLIFGVTHLTRIAGFGYESYEEINMFSYDVKLDFTNVTIALILIGLIGATIDTSMAISSALFEVFEHNPHFTKSQLYHSGITIGKDILGTTANTLFFAFLGEFMTLLIWFQSGHYSFLEIVNSKTFCAQLIPILFSGIGCILVIPITAYITATKLVKPNIISS